MRVYFIQLSIHSWRRGELLMVSIWGEEGGHVESSRRSVLSRFSFLRIAWLQIAWKSRDKGQLEF